MEGKGGEMVGKVESMARRVTACVLMVLLVVGLMPALPEMPQVFVGGTVAVLKLNSEESVATVVSTANTEQNGGKENFSCRTESEQLQQGNSSVVSASTFPLLFPKTAQAEESQMNEDLRIVQLSSNGSTSGVLMSDGSFWTWGDNTNGNLGDDRRYASERWVPTKLLVDVREVPVDGYGAVIKNDGSLWMWGNNGKYFPDLGEVVDTPVSIPRKVMDDVRQVAIGQGFCVVLKDDGSVWTWGYNDSGALGDDTPTRYLGHEYENHYRYEPAMVLDNVREISAGRDAVAAIKNDGSLWMWGANQYNQIGIRGGNGVVKKPIHVMDGIARVSVGYYHTLAVSNTGGLYIWGALIYVSVKT